MKNNKTFQSKKKKIARRVPLFYNFANLFNSGLIESSWIFLPDWMQSRYTYAVLVEVHKEKLASYGYIVGKGRSILITFSDNCGYPSLILNQNFTNGG